MPRSNDTRDRLVEAASGLWHSRSYADVGVSEICAVADVRKGSFYHFFASKQELAVAVIDRHWEESYEAIVVPAMAADETPLGRVRLITVLIAEEVSRLAERYGVVPGCPFGNLAVELSTIDDDVRERLERLFDDQRRVLQALLDGAVAAGEIPPGTDTAEAARAMNAYIEGVLLMSKNANDVSMVARMLPLAARLAVPAAAVENAPV